MSGDLPELPFAPVGAWLRAELPEIFRDPSWSAELISGGLSNITYRLRGSGGTTVILRRPPLGGVLPSAHDMVREHRVLAVIDWELSTLGDPLADLGLALTYWHDLGDAERELIPVAVGVTDPVPALVAAGLRQYGSAP